MPCFSDPGEADRVERAISMSSRTGCNFDSCYASVIDSERREEERERARETKLSKEPSRDEPAPESREGGGEDSKDDSEVESLKERMAECERREKRAVEERDMYKKLYLSTEEGKKKMESFEEWLANGN